MGLWKIIMENIKAYFDEILGTNIHIKKVLADALKALPLILTTKWDFYEANLFNKNILLVDIKNFQELSTDSIAKYFEITRSIKNKIPVAVLKTIDNYKRKRLIERKIPFLIPGKQMYLPDLLIDLKDTLSIARKSSDIMDPATQFLFLVHILKGTIEGVSFKNLANQLGYGKMTISRVADYLKENNLCKITGSKEKQFIFEKNKKDLWNRSLPLLVSPVKRSVGVTGSIQTKDLKASNINALSHYTEIADENKNYYAINLKDFESLTKKNNIQEIEILESETIFEIWKYNPNILAIGNFVDPLSLYLIFREDEDERIQQSLIALINEVKW